MTESRHRIAISDLDQNATRNIEESDLNKITGGYSLSGLSSESLTAVKFTGGVEQTADRLKSSYFKF